LITPGEVTIPAEVSPAPPRRTTPVSTRRRRWLRLGAAAVALALILNEAAVWGASRRLSTGVPLQEFAGLDTAWSEYQRLRGRSYLGLGSRAFGEALHKQSVVLAERVAANYRTPTPSVREAQWKAAATALEQALTVAPGDDVARGTLRYAQGHLDRINGEAAKSRGQTEQAERHFGNAVTAFREAAALRASWPDPFLGLARTFIYGLEDIDRGADAMAEAQKRGHVIGTRETAQLADGYRTRGDALERAADSLGGLPQERDSLTGARDAYRRALELYATIADFSGVAAHIRMTQHRLDIIERKLQALDGGILGSLRDLGRILSGQ
jgi:hypothetical protein